MNTILITGTAKPDKNFVLYDVNIWAQKSGEDIEFIYSLKFNCSGYSSLWDIVKTKVSSYYSESKFTDGGYSRFLDSINIIN